MEFSEILGPQNVLRVVAYAGAGLATLRGFTVWGQVGLPKIDEWPVGPGMLIAGVTLIIANRLVDEYFRNQRTQRRLDDARELTRDAKDTRFVEVQAQLEASELRLALTIAEFEVWKRRCNPPPAREIQAAQRKARENPQEFINGTNEEN